MEYFGDGAYHFARTEAQRFLEAGDHERFMFYCTVVLELANFIDELAVAGAMSL